MIPFIPAALATEAHCLQSMAVGLKSSAFSLPLPHSAPVKVFGPKWMNILYSICCHSTEVDEPLFSRNGTNFGLVMDLTHGVVRLAPGNPCESAFEEISIEG